MKILPVCRMTLQPSTTPFFLIYSVLCHYSLVSLETLAVMCLFCSLCLLSVGLPREGELGSCPPCSCWPYFAVSAGWSKFWSVLKWPVSLRLSQALSMLSPSLRLYSLVRALALFHMISIKTAAPIPEPFFPMKPPPDPSGLYSVLQVPVNFENILFLFRSPQFVKNLWQWVWGICLLRLSAPWGQGWVC